MTTNRLPKCCYCGADMRQDPISGWVHNPTGRAQCATVTVSRAGTARNVAEAVRAPRKAVKSTRAAGEREAVRVNLDAMVERGELTRDAQGRYGLPSWKTKPATESQPIQTTTP